MNLVPESFAMLGTMYKEGQGVSVDLEEAVRCFRRGAELGDVQGHLALAQCYTHGTGVVQSDREALKCYMEAAEMGGDGGGVEDWATHANVYICIWPF